MWTILEDAAALKLVEQVLSDLLDALAFVGNEPKLEVFLPLLQNALSRSKCTVPRKKPGLRSCSRCKLNVPGSDMR